MANPALHIWREVTGSALIWELCLSLMLSDATEHALHKQLGHRFGEGQESNSPLESAPAPLWGGGGALFKGDPSRDAGH